MITSAPAAERNFALGISGYRYADLYEPTRLRQLTEDFYAEVAAADPGLWAEFQAYRDGAELKRPVVSSIQMRMARHLSLFLARLFDIEGAREEDIARTRKDDPIWRFKRDFVLRRALKRYGEHPGSTAAYEPTMALLRGETDDPELATASAVVALMDLERAYRAVRDLRHPQPLPESAPGQVAQWKARLGAPAEQADEEFLGAVLDECERWVAAAVHERKHGGGFQAWVSLHEPEDMHWLDGLVNVRRPNPELPMLMMGPDETLRRRDGFKLTDPRWGLRKALDHAHYCVICHEREKDSCSKGYPLPRRPGQAVGRNPLGVPLNGCPLDEHISEMHALKREGDSIAALAMVILNNPMCPGTGHRICNDCMKGCIYQKQEPVNIPQIETRVLFDVLNLPWGVEIYGLLTRWNPVSVERPYALPYNGINVLVDGLGPAGYTLAQWLLNEGFGVVGIDGLKIEPLDKDLVWDGDTPPRAIRNFSDLQEQLDERVSAGFGGVAEYGITVRWDKNFLKLIYVTLMRRKTFKIFGGVRFGGTITIEDAWALGFDHVAIAAGAGRPTILDIKNNLIPGIRKASDFLMALQLTGAFKRFAMANLQLRLPALVIGGGLTGIDTTTEAFAYYPVQVEKILDRYELLVQEFGEERVMAMFNAEEKTILAEFLEHGRAVRAERQRAAAAGEQPNFIPLVRGWGGVALVYRRRMQDSPAYRINHEEVREFLQEGVGYMECLEPREAIPDEFGHLKAMTFERAVELEPGKWGPSGECVTLPARAVLVAAGTTPNVILEKERPGTLAMDSRRRFFQPFKMEDGKLVPAAGTLQDPGFFTSYEKDGRYITYYGDNNPAYAGSVVKAMASAKFGYREITRLFADRIAALDPAQQAGRDAAWDDLVARLEDGLVARVHEVIRLTPTIIEVVVRAPFQARQFQPGQFYRLQNFEVLSPVFEGTKLQMEGIALTGAWVDKEQGLLSLIALELGVSSRLCSVLKPGEPVIVMGPTGAPSEIKPNENVVLLGGGLGNAVMFSIAKAMRSVGCKVLYFAGYRKPEDVFHRDDIEAGCHQVVWSVDAGEPIQPRRPEDRSFVGNIVQAMQAYDSGQLGEKLFDLKDANRVIAIGSDRMMAAVNRARHEVLKDNFSPDHVAIASINSPMQCMMKEVCAQCLQRHVDPVTGKESFVFSCFNQDQPMDHVDWKTLNDRLRQNTVQEKLANLWLERIFRHHDLARV